MMLSARVSLFAAAMAVGGFFASPAHAVTPMAQPALLTDHGVAKPVEEVGYRRRYYRPYRHGYRRYGVRRYYGGYYRPYRRHYGYAYRPYYDDDYGYGYGYPNYGYGYPSYGYGGWGGGHWRRHW